MFHHKCFHLRVKIDYAVWSVERGESLIGTVIGDCDSRFDNLSEILHQSEYTNCWNLTTVNSRLQTALARMTGCVPFSQYWSIFFARGRELENFGCNTIKFTLFPPPLSSPKTLWIFLWFPRSIFYSPPLGLCWRRLISPPFPPENHVILPKILHPPLPMAKS